MVSGYWVQSCLAIATASASIDVEWTSFYSPIDSSPSTKPLLLAMTRRTQGSMQLHGLFCGILSTLMSLHYNDSVYYPPPHPSPSSIINTRCARRLLFIVGSSWRSQLKIPSKPVRILRLTLYATQLCSGRQVDITPNSKVPIHCVFALL